jgi:hypothetical protein
MSGTRLKYLIIGEFISTAFEEITSRVLDETGVIHSEIKSYEAPARGEPRYAQQVIFLISVGDETCDLFLQRSGRFARTVLAKPRSRL